MRRTLALLAVVALGSSTLAANATEGCSPLPVEALTFKAPVVIDPDAAGGEPVSVVAQDGSITVSAHAGTTHLYKAPQGLAGSGDFVNGYSNQTINWRSTDGGETWKRIGILPPVETGPHSLTSTGFSDPDLAMDQAGNLYNTEINLPQVAVYSSRDDGQSWPIANPVASSGDRPWLVATEPGEVYLLTNAFLARPLLRSTDGGVTFDLVTDWAPINGKPVADPLNPDDGLIGPMGLDGVAISGDNGQSWDEFWGAPLGNSTQFFGTVAADHAGNVYMASAGGYRGNVDIANNGEVVVAVLERATGQWHRLEVPSPGGDALWPWVTAGSDGRVAVTWLERTGVNPQAFSVYVAVTTNALGSVHDCGDGSSIEVPAQWSVANATGRPIHVGSICLDGTACNLTLNADRRLGDFITVNFDLDGRVFIATGDTTSLNPLGGPKPVSNPLFARQASGPLLLEEPIEPRPTRCAVVGLEPPCLP